MDYKLRTTAAIWEEHGGGKDFAAISTFDDLPMYWRGVLLKAHGRAGDDVVKLVGVEAAPSGHIEILTDGAKLFAA